MTTTQERLIRRSKESLLAEDGSLINRNIYIVPSTLYDEQVDKFTKFTSNMTTYLARAIATKMSSNCSSVWENLLGAERPSSAYFTFLKRRLIVEWGETGEYGKPILHDYLNRNIDYCNRVLIGGAVVRSGHIATLKIEGENTRVALLDSLGTENKPVYLETNAPEYQIVKGLISQGIVPVSSYGQPAIPL